jgi:hypothetical protein
VDADASPSPDIVLRADRVGALRGSRQPRTAPADVSPGINQPDAGAEPAADTVLPVRPPLAASASPGAGVSPVRTLSVLTGMSRLAAVCGRRGEHDERRQHHVLLRAGANTAARFGQTPA